MSPVVATCPNGAVLRRFLAQSRSSEEDCAVERHVGACPHCQAQLSLLVRECDNDVRLAVPEKPSVAGVTSIEYIASGGMGEVWRVRDEDFGRDLALKVLRWSLAAEASFAERFVREARICAQLSHPAIVPVHQLGVLVDGRPFYTMKLVCGETLARRLAAADDADGRRLERLRIFEQVCQGMAYAHARRVIHRDLKPQNIMVGEHGEVQIMDWGLAKSLAAGPLGDRQRQARVCSPSDAETGASRHALSTRPHEAFGTAGYMPPEQELGRHEDVDERADVYALGAILCDVLLAGSAPDHSAQPYPRKAEEKLDVVSRLSGSAVDPALHQLAASCLALRREDRPAHAGSVARAVAEYLRATEQRAEQERIALEKSEVLRQEERRRKRLWHGVAVLTVAAAVLLCFGGSQFYKLRHAQAVRQSEVEFFLKQAEAELRVGDLRAAARTMKDAKTRIESSMSEILPAQAADLQRQLAFADKLQSVQLARQTIGSDGLFDNRGAMRGYREVFCEYGFDVDAGEPEDCAARIRRLAVGRQVVDGLDDWALVHFYDLRFDEQVVNSPAVQAAYRRKRDRLLAIAAAADPHPWRCRVRNPELWEVPDRAALDALVKDGEGVITESAKMAEIVAELIRFAGGAAEALLRKLQTQQPQNFWITFNLARFLAQKQDWGDSLRFYQAAMTIDPRNTGMLVNAGAVLWNMGRRQDAIDYWQRVLELNPAHQPARQLLARFAAGGEVKHAAE